MQKMAMLYEGKAKRVYETDEDGIYIVSYKDDATAFNGLKKGSIAGKGAINNRVTNHLMGMLQKQGIPTHFVSELNERESAVKKVRIIPLEVIVRNIAAGSLATRLGIEEGTKLASTVLEFCYKRDDLGDPLVNEYHIRALALAKDDELKKLSEYALQINQILLSYLEEVGIS
ncbi:MAG: phosphoribosylaminoimidazolesuccinocarboxamide synthase, partial [Spirochaetia bacterium]|nr:phosphoribosylaminoimidazolesuccinocarboxamide synthase [Spirochaetia bacterium]